MCTAHPAEARIVTPSAGITAEEIMALRERLEGTRKHG